MNIVQQLRKVLVAVFLVLLLTTTTACGTAVKTDRTTYQPGVNDTTGYYQQRERGNTATGQNFGDWVVQTGRGMIQDVYVRGDNKLGVVISSQVRPNEVRSLARSLAQGFRQNFPNRDLDVLVYAPDKKLIMTAHYDNATKQIEYQSAS